MQDPVGGGPGAGHHNTGIVHYGPHSSAGQGDGGIVRPHSGGGSGNGGGSGVPTFTDTQQSAFDSMLQTLQSFGLGTLSGTLKQLILKGVTDSASLQLALQDTDAWKQRFAGNEMLRQNGLPVLSVAEYLATEKSYAQVMKNFGLPTGFYDDPSDFAKFIGNSVSANELQQRAQMFSDLQQRKDDPAVVAQLQSMGLSQGDILAYTMDPSRAEPLIQQKYQTALLGAAARRSGGVTADNSYLSHLADIGVNEQQASQGYGTIAQALPGLQALGNIYGTAYQQSDLEHEVFENDGAAANKRQKLASQERANFSGSAGVGSGSLTSATGGAY